MMRKGLGHRLCRLGCRFEWEGWTGPEWVGWGLLARLWMARVWRIAGLGEWGGVSWIRELGRLAATPSRHLR
jgi:hypothetical protein